MDPWALFRGGWLGQEECVPHRSGAYATRQRHAHDSFQACGEQEEEWKRSDIPNFQMCLRQTCILEQAKSIFI